MLKPVVLLFLSCAATLARAESVSYVDDVEPILTNKCVACHTCYDAPCQLNLGSGEGILRGASKQLVYDGTRSKAQPTTRLYLDAQGEAGWRKRDFYSVLDPANGQAALIKDMLELGRAQPLKPNTKLPDNLDIAITRSNTCPAPGEFAAYAEKTPHGGMPFAVTGLSDAEYATLEQWLQQGAPVTEQMPEPSAAELRQVEAWETFLNAPGARQDLVSRWLYEHLFLAHLYFEEGENRHFFQVVRSRTPSGKLIDPIATRRPNDDPGTEFYYRLWPIQGVIVHKTHITYPLSDDKLARVRELFFGDDWTLDAIPGYGAQRRANPFETFAAIPARARYQFMLDNAEYFVRTFIRGPVCRGQIATDVIRDNFWALFQAPEHDLYVTDAEYQREATPLLAMPGQFDDIGDLLGLWRNYRDKRNEYEDLRQDAYADAPAADWTHIWIGNDNALLSIFRQHDSASVRKGLLGEIPQTIWWMDYPLLERTYYQLVVNFDVFGNVSHQAQTRLYFDLIRNGAEVNFLRLLPASSREGYLDDWYQNSGKLKMLLDYTSVDHHSPSALELVGKDPKKQFAEQLLTRHAKLNARPDPLNRCSGARCYREGISKELQHVEQTLARLTSRPAGGLKVIDRLPEATMLRVELDDGSREIYSVLRNRAHSNVAFMLGEELRYQPRLDTLTIYPEVLSSYPNFLFTLRAGEIDDFVGQLEGVTDNTSFERVVERWGVRRSHPEFWRYFHDLSERIRETQPLEAGVLDMNRYENL